MATTSGMASPSACGHAITSTVTTRSITKEAASPATNQPTSVATAATTATMVRRNAARSASAWARERELWAWATRRMMPASAVLSPIRVISTRSEPDPFTVPAITVAPTGFGTGRDSPVIIDSFTSLEPSRTTPSAGMPAPGRTSTRSPSESGNRDHLRAIADDPYGRVRQQLRELSERALRLGDRAHLDPVAEDHDRDEGGELPPEIHSGEAEGHREAEHVGDADRKGDERHHPGTTVGELADGALDEHPAAVAEDQRAEQRGNEARSRGAAPRFVAEPVLDHRGPRDGGDREQQRSPELSSEHLDAVTGMHIVGSVGVAITPTIDPVVMPARFAPVGRRRLVVLMSAMRMRASAVLGCHCSFCTVTGGLDNRCSPPEDTLLSDACPICFGACSAALDIACRLSYRLRKPHFDIRKAAGGGPPRWVAARDIRC